jgi:hypothetical protein
MQLDQFLADHPLPYPTSATKIDVEGHENSVLRGMMDCLRRHRPRVVMFEYLQRTNLRKPLACSKTQAIRSCNLFRKGPLSQAPTYRHFKTCLPAPTSC